jgi:hypothetical protein
MTSRTALRVAGLVLSLAPGLRGQSGILDERTQFVVLTGPSIDHQHGPLRAIVLWRGPEGWNHSRNQAERARVDSVYRWARLHADEAGLSFFGSGLFYGLAEPGNQAVTIEGRRFALRTADSALVIMVDVPPGGLSRMVRTAYVAAELPPAFWTKTWDSGDTTFFVHPDVNRQAFLLLEALGRSPVVAAFLR